MMSLWDALRMNMMISYQELVRTFLRGQATSAVINSTIAPADPNWMGRKRVPAPTAVPYNAKLQRVSSFDQILDII